MLPAQELQGNDKALKNKDRIRLYFSYDFPRGHQFPGAFLHTVSGLTKHQLSSEKPLKYSHLDVAGSSGDLPEPTTGSR